jgi:hypothetical protein
VFFIDHDEPEPRQRRENGEARAQDEIRVSARGLAPVAQALSRRESAVERHRPAGWQCFGDALAKLRRQIDFRHEDEHLPPRGDAFGRGGEIDLGLAAAGDALQQIGCERSCGCDDRFGGACLIGIERRAVAFPRGRIAWRNVATRKSSPARRRHERRQHLGENEPHRFLVILRDEFGQPEDICRQWRHVLPKLHDGLQALLRKLGRRDDVDDDTSERATPKAHLDDRTASYGKPVGNPVIEKSSGSDGKGDARYRHGITSQRGDAEGNRAARRARVTARAMLNTRRSIFRQVLGL